MNYYNPYFSMMPYTSVPAVASTGRGLLSGLTGRFSLSSLISGTQKTLGIINQAIPVIKQVGPVVKNAKTMFSVMNEFKKVDTPKKTTNTTPQPQNQATQTIQQEVSDFPQEQIKKTESGPTFFL